MSLGYEANLLLANPANRDEVNRILRELEVDCIMVPEDLIYREQLMERLRELGEHRICAWLKGESLR